MIEKGNEVKATFRVPKLLTKQLKVYTGMHEMSVTAVVIKDCEQLMDNSVGYHDQKNEREWRRSKVLELASQGNSQKEIAQKLQIGKSVVN